MGAAVVPLREDIRHRHLGSVRYRQQRCQRQIVERPPVENFLDDGVGTMHAVVDGADATTRTRNGFAHLVGTAPLRPLPGHGEIFPHLRTSRSNVELDHMLVDKVGFSNTGNNWTSYVLPNRQVKRGDIIAFRYPQDVRQTLSSA